VAEPSGNPSGAPHACRTRTLRMPAAKSPLAGDKIDAPAACAVPFRPYCGGVVTRTRNVSEYMLVLALCLVHISKPGTERVQALAGISRSAPCCHSNETRAPIANPPIVHN